MSAVNEIKIVSECLHGDEDSFKRILGKYAAPSYEFMICLFGPLNANAKFVKFATWLAEDGYSRLGEFKELRGVGLQRFLLYKVTECFSIDTVKYDDEWDRADLPRGVDSEMLALSEAIEKTLWEFFESCLDGFHWQERVIFRLYMEGVVPAAIAEILKMDSTGDVVEMIGRIKLQLKKELSSGISKSA